MKNREMVHYLDKYLGSALIADYCPNGLQVEGREKITKVATAVSADLDTVKKALELELDMLIVHHGIFWNKDPYPIVGSKKEKLELLLKGGINLVAYHLPLDKHEEVGNNWRAAQDLGWKNLEVFEEIGVRGTFAPRPIEVFTAEMEAYYGHGAHVALKGKREVQSAALVSGGAYGMLKKAAEIGVDCFLTGNFDEPAWGVACEERIHFLSLGHSATEKVGPKALARHITDLLQIQCYFIDNDNPF